MSRFLQWRSKPGGNGNLVSMDAAGCVWWLEMWTRCQRRGLSVLFSRFRSIMQTRQHSSYHLLESCDVFLACPPRKGVPSFAVLPEGSSSSILLGGSFTSPDRGSKVRRNQSLGVLWSSAPETAPPPRVSATSGSSSCKHLSYSSA